MATCNCTGQCRRPPYTCNGYSIETTERFCFPQIIMEKFCFAWCGRTAEQGCECSQRTYSPITEENVKPIKETDDNNS